MRVSGNGRAGAPPETTPFGGRLRALREGAGLTQKELAAKAGLTAKAVSALERGERKRPYPHTVRSLADALGLGEEDRLSLLASVQKRGEPSPAAPVPALPVPPTPLLGRGRELGDDWGAAHILTHLAVVPIKRGSSRWPPGTRRRPSSSRAGRGTGSPPT
jgi:transcriptional regulator with XRE-family HTH domain